MVAQVADLPGALEVEQLGPAEMALEALKLQAVPVEMSAMDQ
jgi:hypothetical protein